MRITRVLVAMFLLYGVAVAVASCSGPQPPPFKPIADVKLLMQSVVDPSADVIWDSVATIVTAAGMDERRPRTAQEWTTVRNSAVMLTESGNLLMMVPRAYDGGDWMTMSQGLVDAGNEALRLAEARNADGLFDIGEKIDKACETCHVLYAYEDSPRRKK
jgi:hypothetical protein